MTSRPNEPHRRGDPRPEARPFRWAELFGAEKTALELVLTHLLRCLDLGGEPREGPSLLDRRRSSTTLAVLGGRGSGKTSLLLSAQYATEQPADFWGEDEASRETFRKIESGVRWLQPLDLEPLSKNANLLVAVLVRVRKMLADAFHDQPAADGERGPREHAPHVGGLWLDFERFLRKVAISWDGNIDERKAGIDMDAYAEAHIRVEVAREALVTDLRPLLARIAGVVARAKEPVAASHVVFALPVDDADLNPLRCNDILQYLRLVSAPWLVPIVLAGPDDLHRVLTLHHAGRLTAVRGGTYRQTDVAWAGELAARGLRKLVPPSQRVELRPMKPYEAWDFKPSGSELTLGQLCRCIPLPGAPPPWSADDHAGAEAAQRLADDGESLETGDTAPLRTMADLLDLSRQIVGVNGLLRAAAQLRRGRVAAGDRFVWQEEESDALLEIPHAGTALERADAIERRALELVEPQAVSFTSAALGLLSAPVRNVLDLWQGLEHLRKRWIDINRSAGSASERDRAWSEALLTFLGKGYLDAVNEAEGSPRDRERWPKVFDPAENFLDRERVAVAMDTSRQILFMVDVRTGLRFEGRELEGYRFRPRREPAPLVPHELKAPPKVDPRPLARHASAWLALVHDVAELVSRQHDGLVRATGVSLTPNALDPGAAVVRLGAARLAWPAPPWDAFIDFELLYRAWQAAIDDAQTLRRRYPTDDQFLIDYLACRWILAATGIASDLRRAPRPPWLRPGPGSFLEASERRKWFRAAARHCALLLGSGHRRVPGRNNRGALEEGRAGDAAFWSRYIPALLTPEHGVSDAVALEFRSALRQQFDDPAARAARRDKLVTFLARNIGEPGVVATFVGLAERHRKAPLKALTRREIASALRPEDKERMLRILATAEPAPEPAHRPNGAPLRDGSRRRRKTPATSRGTGPARGRKRS